MSPLLQKEARLFASSQLSVPNYTMEERKKLMAHMKSWINYLRLRISTHTSLGQSTTQEEPQRTQTQIQMQMQGIAHVNHPNANAHANASVNARNKQIFIFSSLHLCLLPTRESAKDQSLSPILEKYFYYACVSLFPCVCVGRVNSLAFLFAFAFASHVWTSLQNLPRNDILIITELTTFSTENWQCF